MQSTQNERPNLANFPDLPRDAKIQPSRGHWYVFVTKYAYDPVKKRSVQKRTYLGQIVDNEFFTPEEYNRFFMRNGHRRPIPLESAKFDRRRADCKEQEQTKITESEQNSLNVLSSNAQKTSGNPQITPENHPNLSDTNIEQKTDDAILDDVIRAFNGLKPVQDISNHDFTNVRYYKFGVVSLVLCAMDHTGLKNDLKEAGFFDETINVLASLVAYNLCKGDNSFYLYSTWSQNRMLPWDRSLDSKELSIFFNYIGTNNQDKINKLFEYRIKRIDKDEFISIDSTNIECESENITFSALGKGKDGNYRNQVSFYALVGSESRQPVCFRYFCGNIHDSVTVKDIISRVLPYGKIVCAIADKGYGSKENIILCCKNNFKIIFSLKKSNFTNDAIDKVRDRLLKMDFNDRVEGHGVYGTTIVENIVDDDGKIYTIWKHIFLNIVQREKVIAKLQRDLLEFEDSWRNCDKNATKSDILKKFYQDNYGELGESLPIRDQNKINAYIYRSGFFVNVSTFCQTAKENIDSYSKRDSIEKYFRISKTDLGQKCVRAHDIATMMGRGLVYFISSIIGNDLLVRLKKSIVHKQKNGKINYKKPVGVRYSIQQFLEMLENVGINRYADGTMRITETTQKLRDILQQTGYPDLFSRPEIGL